MVIKAMIVETIGSEIYPYSASGVKSGLVYPIENGEEELQDQDIGTLCYIEVLDGGPLCKILRVSKVPYDIQNEG